MKLELKENQGVPSSLLWTLAIISGVTVANIYYNQPLLNRISRDLNISEFTANLIAMCSQIGYAIGLLFIIPLGDLYRRRNIILVNISILVVSLLTRWQGRFCSSGALCMACPTIREHWGLPIR